MAGWGGERWDGAKYLKREGFLIKYLNLGRRMDMQKKNGEEKECPCTYPGCPRHGDCDKCKEYHHSCGEKTSCERISG